MQPGQALFVVPAQALAPPAGAFTYVWATGPPAKVEAALARSSLAPQYLTGVAQFSRSPDVQNITRTYGFLRIVAIALVALSLTALLLYLNTRQRSQLVTSAFLRRMGLSQLSQSLSVALESSLLVGLATAIGAVAAADHGRRDRRARRSARDLLTATDNPGALGRARRLDARRHRPGRPAAAYSRCSCAARRSERTFVSTEPLVTLDAVVKRYRPRAELVEALGLSMQSSSPGRSSRSSVFPAAANPPCSDSSPATTSLRRARVSSAATTWPPSHEAHATVSSATTVTYVSQRAADNLFPQLSLQQHLPAGAPTRPFELLGIRLEMDAHPGEFSGGELARASFAVALAQGSPLLVVDEPTAELDRATAHDVLAAMREAASRGQTLVIATHDPDVIAAADDLLDLTQRRPAATPTSPRIQPPGRVALRLDGLTKSYAGVDALRDVSITVRAGELALIIGRSGSGKSTLLMLAGNWIEPDHGTIDPIHTRWHQIAFVPQRFGLVPELTVQENMELPARLVPGLSHRPLRAARDQRAPRPLSGRDLHRTTTTGRNRPRTPSRTHHPAHRRTDITPGRRPRRSRLGSDQHRRRQRLSVPRRRPTNWTQPAALTTGGKSKTAACTRSRPSYEVYDAGETAPPRPLPSR